MRRLISLLLVLLLLSFSFGAAAETVAQVKEDRFDLVFDATQDPGRLSVRFLQLTTRNDGKSGDAAILTSPDGLVMMIDAGNPTTYVDVDRALQALGIERIDYLVASHPHVDHIGGFAQLLYNYEVGSVYTSEVVYPTSHYNAYMTAIAETNTPHVILTEGDTFQFGEEVLVEVLHPSPGVVYYDGYPDNSTQFVNNLSLVMKLTFGESSFLFAGDIYTSAERAIAEKYGDYLQSDIYKVAHHGDASSSSRPFRLAVDPKVAVMMHDGLADLRTYQNFRRAGADVFVSSIDGSVLVSSAGDGEYYVVSQFDRMTDFLD